MFFKHFASKNQVLDLSINGTLVENGLNKHVFSIILFYFFMCDDLSTAQKTLKPSKIIFQFPGWMRKNFNSGISAEGYRRKHEMQVAYKKTCWKNNTVIQTLVTYRH